MVDERGVTGKIFRYPIPANQPGQAARRCRRAGSTAGSVPSAVAGTVAEGVVTRAPNLQLAGTNLGASPRAVHQGGVLVANDVLAAGVAEARLGAASGEHLVFAITIGTGIGGALILDGKPQEGHGAAGEVGHMVIHPDCPRADAEGTAAGRRSAAAARLTAPRPWYSGATDESPPPATW